MQVKTNDARCNGSCADATQVRATRLHKVQVQGRLNEIRIAEMSDGQFFICCTDYYRAIGALGSSKAAEIKDSVMLLIDGAKRPMVFAPLSSVRRLSCNHINRVYRERGAEVVKFLEESLKTIGNERDKEKLCKASAQQKAESIASILLEKKQQLRENYEVGMKKFDELQSELISFIEAQSRILVIMEKKIDGLDDENRRLKQENEKFKSSRLEMIRYDDGCYNFTQVSNMLGLDRVTDLTNSLIYLDVLTRDSDLKLNPTDDYKDKGYFGYRSYRVDDAATGQQMYRKNLVCTQEGKDFILANKTLIVDAIREWRGKKQYQSNDYGRAAL